MTSNSGFFARQDRELGARRAQDVGGVMPCVFEVRLHDLTVSGERGLGHDDVRGQRVGVGEQELCPNHDVLDRRDAVE